MTSLVLATNAETEMHVKTFGGQDIVYDVDSVAEVYFVDKCGTTISGSVGKYTYVDLGLKSGLMWATYNVGATSTSERGDFFAWGETESKKTFTWDNYKWTEDNGSAFTKYSMPYVGELLESEDDAAFVNWGEGWRMPTDEELIELVNSCEWEWVEDFCGTGIPGSLGTSLVNSHTIFMPANGTVDNKGSFKFNERCDFWAKTRDPQHVRGGYFLHFNSKDQDLYDYGGRYVGRSIRAVVSLEK